MSFESDIDDFIAVVETRSDKVFRGSSLGLFTRIIQRTPVLTGRLVNNWQIGIDKQNNKQIKAVKNKSSDIAAKNKATRKTSKDVQWAKHTNTIYFSNNLPYAQAIEDGGSDKNNRRGMVKVSLLEFKRHVQKEVDKVLKGD